jgi:hypothetical protein
MGDSSFNWYGPFIGLILGIITTKCYNIYKKFEGESLIKGELEGIAHNLEVAGKPNTKIEVDYGASYIRHHPLMLFGEHNSEVLRFYTGIFDKYNSDLENGTYEENLRMQQSIINQIGGILSNPWLKKIPSEPSIIGFIKYLLKRDAAVTYIPLRI